MKEMFKSTGIYEAPTECQADETHVALGSRKQAVVGQAEVGRQRLDIDKENFSKLEVIRGWPPSSFRID